MGWVYSKDRLTEVLKREGRWVMNTDLNTMICRHADLNYCLWHSETSYKASSTPPVASPTAPPSKSKARTIRRPIPLYMLNSSQQIPLQRIPETRRIWRVPQDLPHPIRARTRVAGPRVQAHRLLARAVAHLPHRLDTQPLRLLCGNQTMRRYCSRMLALQIKAIEEGIMRYEDL